MNPFGIFVLIEVFVIIIVIIIQPGMNINIKPPPERLPKNTIVVLKDYNMKKTHFYDVPRQQWKEWSQIPSTGRKVNFSIENIDCNTNRECRELSTPTNDSTKSIALIGVLNDEVSGMISDSCLSYPELCTKVQYQITAEGRVDRKKLLEEHPFMEKLFFKKAG